MQLLQHVYVVQAFTRFSLRQEFLELNNDLIIIDNDS